MVQDDRVLPSLLDRLVDGPRARTGDHSLRDLRRAVRRDVEALLNTRRRAISPPEGLRALHDSLLEYGVPDSSAANLSTIEERQAFLRELQSSLRRFEPRFGSVRVELLDTGSEIDRVLRFRVSATLHARPAPEPIGFESQVDPVSREIEIRG